MSYADAARQLPPVLLAADFVYVRHASVDPPLAPAYTGPFAVISRSEKFFMVELCGRHEFSFVDRLKALPVLPGGASGSAAERASLFVSAFSCGLGA